VRVHIKCGMSMQPIVRLKSYVHNLPKPMAISKIVYFACVTLALTGDTTYLFDTGNYASKDVLIRDVAVIGGESTGTYAAVNLKNIGKSIVLVERKNVLGSIPIRT
jgi:heterodisulfide reductase subunit A-like polyferredoxin